MPTISPPIDVDPEAPSGIGVLAAAALQHEKIIPEEILCQMPGETISVSELVATDLPRGLRSVLRSLGKKPPVLRQYMLSTW
jgi:hypothetical protein